jgi:hypothetical protein
MTRSPLGKVVSNVLSAGLAKVGAGDTATNNKIAMQVGNFMVEVSK